MTRTEIMSIIPHRANMLLVDEAYVENNIAHGKYLIRGDEWFLQGHFPENPIVPGVVLCEMMAQATCVLLAGQGSIKPLFTGLDKTRFKSSVLPGDTFRTVSEIIRSKGPFYFARANGYVEDKLCATAEFSFALQK